MRVIEDGSTYAISYSTPLLTSNVFEKIVLTVRCVLPKFYIRPRHFELIKY
jgi:hypothetical protein